MASEIKKFYEFGRFRFDARRLYLEHDGAPVSLPPKSLEALRVLLEEKGKTVTRENFLEKIWAESFVEDANLTVAVSTLRKTLSVYENETFIQTVPRRGYRFVGDAQEKIEILDEPIVIERRAVEQLTVEKTSTPTETKRRTFYLLFALLSLILLVGAFAVWRQDKRSAVYLSKNPAANDAFQKGVVLLEKRQVCESAVHFREAVSLDADFALAYSNLAAALAMCDFTNEADEALAKALALNPDLSEVQATDGFIKLFRRWDWDGAETALRRAVALDSNSAKAHHWLGVLLSVRGRLGEAEGEIRRATEIEPNSPLYQADLCQIYYFQVHPARAVGECQKALEIDPDFLFTPKYARDVYLAAGDERKAWEFEAKNLSNLGFSPASIKVYEEIFSREGFKGIYKAQIDFFLEQIKNGNANAKNRVHFTLTLAENYALLGDRENALYWFEQSFSDEKQAFPFSMAYLAVEPRYAFLRGDERFQAILRRMKLAN